MPSEDDIRWLSGAVAEAYAAQTVAEFAKAMMGAVDRRFNLMASTLEELGPGAGFYALHSLRTSVAPPKDFEAFIHDNPIERSLFLTPDAAVIQMRRSVTMDAWARTDHFNGIARPMGFNDLVAIVAQSRPTSAAVAIYRDKKFTDSEYRLLCLLRPHLAAVWKRVKGYNSDKNAAPLRIILAANLSPLEMSPPAVAIIMQYFNGWRQGLRLPGGIVSWILQCREDLRRVPYSNPLRPLYIESVRGRLVLRCFPERDSGLVQIKMLEVPAIPNFLLLTTRGFTSRECEVLHWLSHGKRDAEIAKIQGTAVRTVNKHVEHVLGKLKTTNRTSAVFNATYMINSGDP